MPFTPGETIGSYRIIEQLGHGGMATVYKAYHPPLDRDVAIKVLHPAFKNDPQFFVRFQREARIVAKLEHSNIVPVYDFNEHEGEPYLVMRYVQGDTLKPHLQAGALSPAEVLRIMRPVCNALAYAHEQGVLHRDIKPSNIMLTPDGGVYLTDFGLARMVQAGESTLSQDMMVGTPQYISPEQAQGERDLDGRTDIYSLGVVLFEMLTGSVPFSGDTPFAVVHDHIYKPLPLPNTINPDIDPRAEKVILRALAKDKSDRFETVQDFWQALEGALTPQEAAQAPTVARIAEDEPQPAPTKKSKKKKFIMGGAAAALLVLACLFVVIILNSEDDQGLPPPDVAQPEAQPPAGEPPRPPADRPQDEPPPPPADEGPSPQEAERLHQEGRRLASQGDLPEALAKFEAAAAADPHYVPVYFSAATALLDAGRLQDAIEALNFGLENNPEEPRLGLFLGRLQIENGRLPEAREIFEAVLEHDPENLMAYVGLARVNILSGDIDAAQALFAEAQQINPDAPETRILEAQILWHSGNKRDAVEILRDVVRAPDLPAPLREELRQLLNEYGAKAPSPQ